jgi:MSHA pilin protein MshD
MNKNRGFTLIEIVMGIVLLAIIMPGVMFYFIQGVKDSAVPQIRTTAIFLAEALMEEIMSKEWDEGTAIDSICNNASATLGVDGGESRAGYDDIDDFEGLDNTPPQDSQGTAMSNYPGFRQQATVGYVATSDLNTTVAGPTCYKRIAVTITGGGEDTQIVSLMSSY